MEPSRKVILLMGCKEYSTGETRDMYGENRNLYFLFMTKYNIKIDFKERGREDVKCIVQAQDRENFRFYKMRRIFRTAEEQLADQGTLCSVEFVTKIHPT